jgi:hydrogenase nickel incorporation protein HypA/HybF
LKCLQDCSFRGFAEYYIMHELKIAEDLTAIVLETAKQGNLTKVTGVNISFGQLVQIVPEIFEFAFSECVRDTLAQDASLSIEILPVRMECTICGFNFDVKENRFACNNCGSTDLKILQGKELFVKSIEGE